MLFSRLYSPCLSGRPSLAVFLLQLSSPRYQKDATEYQDSWIPLFLVFLFVFSFPGLTLNLTFLNNFKQRPFREWNTCVSMWHRSLLLNLKRVRNHISSSCVLIFAIWKLSVFDNHSPKWKQAAWNKSVTVNTSHISQVHLSKLQTIHLFSLLLVIIWQLPELISNWAYFSL